MAAAQRGQPQHLAKLGWGEARNGEGRGEIGNHTGGRKCSASSCARILASAYRYSHRLRDRTGGESPLPPHGPGPRALPDEQAALKCLYLTTRSLDPAGAGHDGPQVETGPERLRHHVPRPHPDKMITDQIKSTIYPSARTPPFQCSRCRGFRAAGDISFRRHAMLCVNGNVGTLRGDLTLIYRAPAPMTVSFISTSLPPPIPGRPAHGKAGAYHDPREGQLPARRRRRRVHHP
jgi:hypothetical protein